MARGRNKATAIKAKPAKPAGPKPIQQDDSQDSKTRQDAPKDLQQQCLNIFRDVFQPEGSDSNVLQEVKGHLYNRDFAAAFGKAEYLRAYASRWSPSRALGYLPILHEIRKEISHDRNGLDSDDREPLRTVSIGGGAGAEVVGLAGYLSMQRSDASKHTESVHAKFVDIAAWDQVVADLRQAVVTAPTLSRYASPAAKEVNTALLSADAFVADFEQLDALSITEEHAQGLFGNADLVTLMFTLNELYSTSMPKTQQMLSRLTANLRPGAHLLVVDSPGSYSTISINGAEKKYPMQWLLDYTLLGSRQTRAGGDSPAKWEKLVSDDSRWFRVPQGLQYPIELENMRYQIHLYRRLAAIETDT